MGLASVVASFAKAWSTLSSGGVHVVISKRRRARLPRHIQIWERKPPMRAAQLTPWHWRRSPAPGLLGSAQQLPAGGGASLAHPRPPLVQRSDRAVAADPFKGGRKVIAAAPWLGHGCDR